MPNTVQLTQNGQPVFPATDASVVTGLPAISTDISADATSDTKTTSPKAVKDYVDGKGYEVTSNKVTSLSSGSTDTQYPSAKAVYDAIPEDKIFIATIGTTPFADIKAAYNAGKTIIGKDGSKICSLVGEQIGTGGVGLTAVTFGFIDGSNNLQQLTINSSNTITSSTQSIYNGTFTVKSKSGNTTTNVSDFTANQSAADDVTFIQGSNVTLTPDATNRTITIAASVPTISTSISTDASSDVKTASPKAVKTYVDGIVGNIETLLASI